jgi:mRNA interferase RelE/StbE
VPGGYELVVDRRAAKELKSINQPDLKRLVLKIGALAQQPFPPDALKLTGVPGYRLRQGDWRVIYEVDEAARRVTVLKVAHRREAYRGMK